MQDFLFVPSSDAKCAPLTLVDRRRSRLSGWLGGDSPIGHPPTVPQDARFLLAISVDESRGAYVFVVGAPLGLRRRRGQVHVVLHPWAASERSTYAVEDALVEPQLGLLRGPTQEDWLEDYDGSRVDPLPFSKLGGRAALGGADDDALDRVQALEERGYRLLLQLTMPRPWDAWPGGNWPFGEDRLWLFVASRRGSQQFEWAVG